MFGASIDENLEELHVEQEANDSEERNSQGGSDKSGNINEVSIDSIKLTAKNEKDKEQLELEKEFED